MVPKPLKKPLNILEKSKTLLVICNYEEEELLETFRRRFRRSFVRNFFSQFMSCQKCFTAFLTLKMFELKKVLSFKAY
jgi:hypothetical protein